MVNVEKYSAIFRLAVIHSFKNYKNLIGLGLFLVTCLLIFAHLWKLTATQTVIIHLPPDQLLWYIALNEWVLIAIPEIQQEMELDLRSGRLAYLLPRPLSYLGAIFFEGLGILYVNLFVLGLVAFLFTWVVVGIFPFDVLSFGTILVLGVLAGMVGIIFKMIVGISAFWLQEVTPFDWIWEKLLFALGGLILPLAAYPLWIQKIAYCTPFPGILGQRSALAIDFNFHSAFQVAESLLFWGFISLSCLIFFYRKGLRILEIEGG